MPALTPLATSVYSLSPTITAWPGSKPVRSRASRAMAGWGLPMTRGLRPVARNSISHMLPQSGTEPYQVGHTQSGLVAINSTPRFSRMQASSSFWKVSSVSKAAIRQSTPSSKWSVTEIPAPSSWRRKVRVPKA